MYWEGIEIFSQAFANNSALTKNVIKSEHNIYFASTSRTGEPVFWVVLK